MDRFWNKALRPSEDACWEWQGSSRGKGYGQYWHGGRPMRAHRVAWLLTKGGIPRGKHVLHTCDNRKCINPRHLYLGTNEDNCRDKALRGWHGSQKLTNAQVEEIRRASGRQADLAHQYGVTDKTISEIRSGKSRAHAPGATAPGRVRKVQLKPLPSPPVKGRHAGGVGL